MPFSSDMWLKKTPHVRGIDIQQHRNDCTSAGTCIANGQLIIKAMHAFMYVWALAKLGQAKLA